MLTDSHAHLDLIPEFQENARAVLARAAAAGVTRIVTIGAGHGLTGSRTAVQLAGNYPAVWATVGVHPHEAHTLDEAAAREIKQLASHPRVVAVGETGLDFHHDRSPRHDQREAFRRQLNLARELQKPVIVHSREAQEETLELLDEDGGPGTDVVIHCFSGDLLFARELLSRGALISFAGNLTDPEAASLREVAARLPAERMLIETDAPYLTPTPLREKGAVNEPANLRRISGTLASLKGLTDDDIARITTRNATRFFRLEPEGGVDEPPRIAYRIRDSLYLNLTNRCTLACVFCGKRKSWAVKGHELRLREGEPSVEELLDAVGDPRGDVREIVFCGYGEPLLRIEALKTVARRMKELGMRVRVNTDGLASLVHGRDVVPELVGLVDCVSVSMNAPDAETHARICPSSHGPAAFPAMIDFVRRARDRIPEVVVTAVALPGLDVESCRRLAADLGVPLRVREYNEIG